MHLLSKWGEAVDHSIKSFASHRVRDQHTGLADRSIAHHHQLDVGHRHGDAGCRRLSRENARERTCQRTPRNDKFVVKAVNPRPPPPLMWEWLWDLLTFLGLFKKNAAIVLLVREILQAVSSCSSRSVDIILHSS